MERRRRKTLSTTMHQDHHRQIFSALRIFCPPYPPLPCIYWHYAPFSTVVKRPQHASFKVLARRESNTFVFSELSCSWLISYSFREALTSRNFPKSDSLLHHYSPDMPPLKHQVERRRLRGRSSVLIWVSDILSTATHLLRQSVKEMLIVVASRHNKFGGGCDGRKATQDNRKFRRFVTCFIKSLLLFLFLFD